MPLHDWTDRDGFENVHNLWMVDLVRSLQATLPPGYRAVTGTTPTGLVALETINPDVSVRAANGHPRAGTGRAAPAPDLQVAVAVLEEDPTVQVTKNGLVVAVVELISPRNKDRSSARAHFAGRYIGYLRGGIHLLLVDVHPRPIGLGFPAMMAAGLAEPLPAPAAPSVVSYRVGPPAATGGRMLDYWYRPLVVGQDLPEMPLPLNYDDDVMVDLEGTYSRAARDGYIV